MVKTEPRYVFDTNTLVGAALLAKPTPGRALISPWPKVAEPSPCAKLGLAEMSQSLPKFARPPVTETVIGVQFVPLKGYTTAHAGWYWTQYLGLDWAKVDEAPRLDEFQETFGAEREFSLGTVRFRPQPAPNRVRFVRSSRMVQIQDSRFIYNWIRELGKSDYPSYSQLLPEFEEKWEGFRGFASEADLGEITPDHWEVTYVNMFPQGDLWDEPKDWAEILPGLLHPAPAGFSPTLDGFTGQWQFVVGKNRARLRVRLQHGKTLEGAGDEVLKLELLARGPVIDRDLVAGLDFGHEAIVSSFAALSSAAAHKRWRKIHA